MEVVKGNWVGFDTIFYNQKNGLYSRNINNVIDYSNLEIDLEGLAAYMDFGYCVFGRTPVKDVMFLLPNQSLNLIDGKLIIQNLEDQTVALLEKEFNEREVLDMIKNDVNDWASTFNNQIVIPTSGGFDSRLLNSVLSDKSKILSYTYGTSQKQMSSREVVYAQELSKRLQTKWSQIELGKFNIYQDEWFDLFGCSVGSFGTYHMEFYKEILTKDNRHLPLLSGIIGDAWAGSINLKQPLDAKDYYALGYTHHMHADAQRAVKLNYIGLAEELFDKQKDLLKHPKYRILTAMRTKMPLLQSLISIPNHYGFKAYSPFINERIATSMLGISEKRRLNRIWQRDYFRENNILFEEEKHKYTYQNSLNYYSLSNHKLEPLDVKLLREIIDDSYLLEINKKLDNISIQQRLYQTFMHTPKIKGMMKMLGFKNDLIKAYFAYLTIKPIEKLLLKRNSYV